MTLAFVRTVTIAALLGANAFASDAPASECSFDWDMTRELALFATDPTPVSAGNDSKSSPPIDQGVLYSVQMRPRGEVTFAHAPGKDVPSDKPAFAGLLIFRPPSPGVYRVTLNEGMWVDVVNSGQLVDSSGFRGRQRCGAIHKSVEWSLPTGLGDLVVQVSGAATNIVRLTITKVNASSGGQ